MWLARLTGCPLIPTGFSAAPAVRHPRWDRHLVPLPGARVAGVAGEPMFLTRDDEVDETLRYELGERIEQAEERARALLADGNGAASQPRTTGRTAHE